MLRLVVILLVLCYSGKVDAQAAGTACADDSECDAGLFCQAPSGGGTKTCRNAVGGTCDAEGPLEDVKCVEGSTCVTNSGGQILCTCGDLHSPNSDNSGCVAQVLIGAACSTGDDDPPCIDNAMCTDATCSCDAMYTANAANNKCLLLIGESCTTSDECVDGDDTIATCDSDTCSCTTNYMATDNNDGCKLKLGQTCTGNDDCGINAMCDTSADPDVCTCNADFTDFSGRCGKESGAACSADSECQTGVTCSDDKCGGSGAVTLGGSVLLMLLAYLVPKIL